MQLKRWERALYMWRIVYSLGICKRNGSFLLWIIIRYNRNYGIHIELSRSLLKKIWRPLEESLHWSWNNYKIREIKSYWWNRLGSEIYSYT